MYRIRTVVYLKPELREMVNGLALKHNVSQSRIVNEMLESGLYD